MRKISINQLIHFAKFYIHDLLHHPKELLIMWCIEDVQTVRPDLDVAQSWTVLKRCASKYDSGLGINWKTIEFVAQEVFPLGDD